MSSESRSLQKCWFTTEIQHMMHGFGDCATPLVESAALIESIVYKQVNKVEEVAVERGAKMVGLEEFVYLLRKDKDKLKRLYQFVEFKDLKASAVKGCSLEEEENTGTAAAEMEQSQPVRRRMKMFQDFLSQIDVTGELFSYIDNNLDDHVKLARKIRAELMTRHMNAAQYAEYCEARQASFAPRYRSGKFKEWLMTGVDHELKINPFGMEALSYLAFEMVAEIIATSAAGKNVQDVANPLSTRNLIVDMSLIVRRDRFAVLCDPVNQSSTYDTRSMEGGASLATPTNTAITQEFLSSRALHTDDIQEALRRYNQPTGPFSDFSKSPLVYCSNFLLCT